MCRNPPNYQGPVGLPVWQNHSVSQCLKEKQGVGVLLEASTAMAEVCVPLLVGLDPIPKGHTRIQRQQGTWIPSGADVQLEWWPSLKCHTDFESNVSESRLPIKSCSVSWWGLGYSQSVQSANVAGERLQRLTLHNVEDQPPPPVARLTRPLDLI
ncbi:Hypothetical predicted protein [Pelobates cultripes]|uniref:Uncharacterized protein n=1 Tax=Pelobates cultripes TaxID=61616 RepID=A0AAD1WNS2_PELCU|nr:Hypothetical predicted protein [Pelobates cultripes]